MDCILKQAPTYRYDRIIGTSKGIERFSNLSKNNKQMNQCWKAVFEAMMSFVMRDGVMGTSQDNSKKKGFYVMPRLTNDEVIRRCKEKHGNKYLYDKVDYVDDKTNILIGCRQHGYFLAKSTESL